MAAKKGEMGGIGASVRKSEWHSAMVALQQWGLTEKRGDGRWVEKWGVAQGRVQGEQCGEACRVAERKVHAIGCEVQ